MSIFGSKPDKAEDINLGLTIIFNGEQEIEIPAASALGIPNGKATFGIRKGKLSISFSECRILLETIGLGQPFDIYLEVEQTQEQGQESNIKGDVPKPALSGTAKETQKSTRTIQDKEYQVTSSGFEAAHSWKFEVRNNSPCLVGKLSKENLGTIKRKRQSSCVKAVFTAEPQSVALTGGRLGLTTNISRTKLACIERALALRYVAPLLQPCMSEVEWNG